MIVDLHTHSTCSDGQYSVKEIIEMSKQKNCEIISITDHDTIEGIKFARECSKEQNILFVSGIEICTSNNSQLHILGYNIDEQNENLLDICDFLIEGRKQRVSRIYEYLASRGIELKKDSAEHIANKDTVGRPHFARAMVEQKFCDNIEQAFLLHLNVDEFYRVDRPKPHAQKSIEAITNANGIAVLAHPCKLNMSDNQLELLIRQLKEFGLKGIECFYSTNTPFQTKKYIEIARKYNLGITAGSDFHGEKMRAKVNLGIEVPADIIDEIYDFLKL